MKRPLFSCVIPVKGARPYFDQALESLLSQGMGDDLEIIVQDADVRSGGVGELGVGELNHEIHERHENGRGVRGRELAVSDGGLEVVRWFREADKGQSDALNKGFAKARGEWLLGLNADDVLLPGALNAIYLIRLGCCMMNRSFY
jgi:glycosyltransferase involved in cell wall biosynthesis